MKNSHEHDEKGQNSRTEIIMKNSNQSEIKVKKPKSQIKMNNPHKNEGRKIWNSNVFKLYVSKGMLLKDAFMLHFHGLFVWTIVLMMNICVLIYMVNQEDDRQKWIYLTKWITLPAIILSVSQLCFVSFSIFSWSKYGRRYWTRVWLSVNLLFASDISVQISSTLHQLTS